MTFHAITPTCLLLFKRQLHSVIRPKLEVIKIFGSEDGVADEQSIMHNRTKLPPTAKFVRIEGANHAQFGYYGFQLGDNSATISKEKQQAETANQIVEFVKQ